MKFIVFIAVVVGVALADPPTPCPDEVKDLLRDAFTECRGAMTTPLPDATPDTATESDESPEEHGHGHGPSPAVKRFFDECVSGNTELMSNTDVAPIIANCVTKFANGEITQAKKEKCIMKKLMKSCGNGRHGPFSTTAASA